MIGLSPLSWGHPLRFQPKWVRPSTGSYPRFSLPQDSSPGFASAACDSLAILKARFRCGSFPNLTSPHTATRWLILQKARRHPARGLRLLVGARFQVLFHSPLGVLFTFPSRYSYAIGQTGILRLTRRSGRIHTGFHESRATRETPSMVHAHTATGPSPSTARYPTRFASRMHLSPQPTASAVGQAFPRHHARNPRRVSHAHGLAIIRFRSPLLTEYPLLQVLRCFTSLRTPRTSAVPAHDGWRVAPFGHPGIKAMSAAPPGLSRPHTSFIGTVCQGIHHTPITTTTTRPP